MLYFMMACGTSPIEDGWNKNGVTTIKDSYVSVFSIETEQNTLALIDAGGSNDAKGIQIGLEKNNQALIDIKHILITHAHTDHVAGLSSFPNAQTYAMPDEHERIEEENEIEIDNSLTDGEPIVIDELTILPLWVPGHTPGNTVFLVNEILIMGDTASSTNKGEIKPSPSFFNEDQEMAEQAIVDLYTRIVDESLDVSWILFSHSGPLEGTDALERYRP